MSDGAITFSTTERPAAARHTPPDNDITSFRGVFVALKAFDKLIDVLTRTRRFLLLPDNDFAWSHWADAESTVRDIDGFIQTLTEGRLPPQMDLRIHFAPTGAIQEVSLSSGWGDEFIHLSIDFDHAVEAAYSGAAAG